MRWQLGDLADSGPLPDKLDAVVSCGPLDHFSLWLARAPLLAPQIVAFGSTSLHVKQESADPAERDLAARLAAAEQRLMQVQARDGIAVTVLRPTLVWGAGMDRSLSRIAGVARRLGGFALPASATGLRQPVHVDDLADAVLKALQRPGRQWRGYDLPGGQTLDYRQMISRVLAALPGRVPLLVLPTVVFAGLCWVAARIGWLAGFTPAMRQRMQQDLVFDDAPARADLGWSPRGFSPSPAELGLDQ